MSVASDWVVLWSILKEGYPRDLWIPDVYVQRACKMNHVGWMDVTFAMRSEAKDDYWNTNTEGY